MYAKAKDIVTYHHPSNVNIILLGKFRIPCRASREANMTHQAPTADMVSTIGSLFRYFGQSRSTAPGPIGLYQASQSLARASASL